MVLPVEMALNVTCSPTLHYSILNQSSYLPTYTKSKRVYFIRPLVLPINHPYTTQVPAHVY